MASYISTSTEMFFDNAYKKNRLPSLSKGPNQKPVRTTVKNLIKIILCINYTKTLQYVCDKRLE